MKRRGVYKVLGVLLVILFLTLSFCAGLVCVFEAPLTLAFGWPNYLWRVIPELHPDLGSVVTAVVCLVGVTFGAHTFLRWLYGAWGVQEKDVSANPEPRPWPWKRTLQLVGLVVLMFVSGIAITGMVHQTGWLIRSPQPLIQDRFSEVPPRMESMNKLKQIVVGSHSYHDNQTPLPHLPQSRFDVTGRPMHSWQTELLPFLEQDRLYTQIDRTKPWTDLANANAMATQVKVYHHPSLPYDPVNGYGVSHYAGNAHIVLSDTPKTLNNCPQGLSNTILAGEVSSNFQAWGDPLNARDPRLGVSGHPNGFGGANGKPAQFGMLDGSVRTFDPKELAELVGKVPE